MARQTNIITFEQVPVFINNEIVLCSSVAFSNGTTLTPDYTIQTPQNVRRVYSTNYPTIQLNIEYYPTFNDIVYNNLLNFTNTTVNLGGVVLKNGYVTSMNLTVNPQAAVKATADITFFLAPNGFLNKLGLHSESRTFIKKAEDSIDATISHGAFAKFTQELVKIPMNLTFNHSVEVYPRQVIDELMPIEIRKGNQKIEVRLDSEYLPKYVTMDGENANFSLELFDVCGKAPISKEYQDYVKYFYTKSNLVYNCNGKIQTNNFNVVSDDWVKSSIAIVQY